VPHIYFSRLLQHTNRYDFVHYESQSWGYIITPALGKGFGQIKTKDLFAVGMFQNFYAFFL